MIVYGLMYGHTKYLIVFQKYWCEIQMLFIYKGVENDKVNSDWNSFLGIEMNSIFVARRLQAFQQKKIIYVGQLRISRSDAKLAHEVWFELHW